MGSAVYERHSQTVLHIKIIFSKLNHNNLQYTNNEICGTCFNIFSLSPRHKITYHSVAEWSTIMSRTQATECYAIISKV